MRASASATLAEIRNNIGAIDLVLGTLGYEDDLDAQDAVPAARGSVCEGCELTRAIQDELRCNGAPMTSREMAQAIVALSDQDTRDRRHF
ncbi:MAG TPA: hypothetical protein VHG92_12075 [Afifellaceae bacterium]|nr:hypothetical protein [Afifellaceae bacterium]